MKTLLLQLIFLKQGILLIVVWSLVSLTGCMPPFTHAAIYAELMNETYDFETDIHSYDIEVSELEGICDALRVVVDVTTTFIDGSEQLEEQDIPIIERGNKKKVSFFITLNGRAEPHSKITNLDFGASDCEFCGIIPGVTSLETCESHAPEPIF